ncbi:MAG: BON domain-containing protein [Isosphaeraceae bacterium]
MMFGLKRISTALGLMAVTASVALGQGIAPNANQMTADAVASSLRGSRGLEGYRIEIQAQGGLVTLTGTLASPIQKADAVTRAQRVAGVRGVVDQLQLSNDRSVLPVQYQPQMAMGGRGFGGGDMIAPGTAGGGPIGGAPIVSDGGPVPEGPAGMMGATQASMPGYPNYAWPSYAPYPNYSAVGYPTVYPWQAWPNIGPFYPYPEVPLDWRAVTLRWDDGIWWLDFKKHYTRPFFTPYPFGLFAY